MAFEWQQSGSPFFPFLIFWSPFRNGKERSGNWYPMG